MPHPSTPTHLGAPPLRPDRPHPRPPCRPPSPPLPSCTQPHPPGPPVTAWRLRSLPLLHHLLEPPACFGPCPAEALPPAPALELPMLPRCPASCRWQRLACHAAAALGLEFEAEYTPRPGGGGSEFEPLWRWKLCFFPCKTLDVFHQVWKCAHGGCRHKCGDVTTHARTTGTIAAPCSTARWAAHPHTRTHIHTCTQLQRQAAPTSSLIMALCSAAWGLLTFSHTHTHTRMCI
eukprot:1160823-Pelagomonas_calceolata.AAC.4